MQNKTISEKIKLRLKRIYNTVPYSEKQLKELIDEIDKIKVSIVPDQKKWSEESVFLITYGDSIRKNDEKPLVTLHRFLLKYLGKAISHIHILPFFPYSSDDGFSIIDYRKVNPSLGSWNDIMNIGKDYQLMFDLVINHVSQQSEWFQNYCKGVNPGKDYFIEVDPDTDLSAVVRPRSLPLLTNFKTDIGSRHVWTTFSADQIDLNFSNPTVLFEILKVFLFYLHKGARIIRLDAIAFLWKEVGTNCLHLPQTHEIVKLMHDIAGYINPSIILITETNVPNKENLSYFGNGDEADIVYQFSLPPLLLHALYTSNSTYLNQWATTLSDIPAGCTFFNFTASHDGIGVRPLEGLLPQEEIVTLAHAMEAQGGYISTRRNKDNTDSPYEMNITYIDALKNTIQGPDEFQHERFLCSQTLMMSFNGIPAFYIHNLLGTHNDHDSVAHTGMYRSINRHKWNADDLFSRLKQNTEHSLILSELLRRISIRKKESMFHPDLPQAVIIYDPDLFILERGKNRELLVLANLSRNLKKINPANFIIPKKGAFDLLGGCKIGEQPFILKPYQVCWIKKG